MKLIITLTIDPGDMPEHDLAGRIRNRKGYVGSHIPEAAKDAANNAMWLAFPPGGDDYRQPRVTRAVSRAER